MITLSMTTVAIDPVPAAILSLCLAVLWLAAGLHKLADLQAFAGALQAYDIAPRALLVLLGPMLPVLELALAAGLLNAVTRPAAGVLGALLLLGYAAAMALNLRRGRRDLDCGCMGFGTRSRISSTLVWRNALAALASLCAGLLPRASRASGWMDTWTIIAAVMVIVLLYLALEGLRAAAQRSSRYG